MTYCLSEWDKLEDLKVCMQLQSHWNHGDFLGWLTKLEYCGGWVQAIKEGQAGAAWGGHALHETAMGCVSADVQWAGDSWWVSISWQTTWMTVWWVPQTALLGRKRRWGFLNTAGRVFKFTGPMFYERFEAHQNMSQGEYSSAWEVQAILGVHWRHFPDTGDQGANERRCSTGPHTNKKELARI